MRQQILRDKKERSDVVTNIFQIFSMNLVRFLYLIKYWRRNCYKTTITKTLDEYSTRNTKFLW